MGTRVHQVALVASLTAPLAWAALTAPPFIARPLAQPANRFLGPSFPPLLDSNGNGHVDEGIDTPVPITIGSNQVTITSPWAACSPASGNALTTFTFSGDNNGRFTTAERGPDNSGRTQSVTITDDAATMFSYQSTTPRPSTRARLLGSNGTGTLADFDQDGDYEKFLGIGFRGSGLQISFFVTLVTSVPNHDVDGDAKPDYVSIFLPQLPTHVVDPADGCQDTLDVGRVFVPLADCDGDGVPDCISTGLPQFFDSPRLVRKPVSPDDTDLFLLSRDTPDPIIVGNHLTYELTVTNTGPAAATGVTVDSQTEPLTPKAAGGARQATFVSASPSQGTCSNVGLAVACSLGNMAFNGRATISIVVATTSTGVLCNTATVSSTSNDPNPNSDSATACTIVNAQTTGSDLALTMMDSPDPVAVGADLTYLLTVTNNGPDPATGVMVSDTLPAARVGTHRTDTEQLTFVSATPSQGTCGSVGLTVTCDLGGLASAAAATISIVATTTADAVLGNIATVSSTSTDPVVPNNTATATTTVGQPGPTTDSDGDGLLDDFENTFGLDPNDPTGADGANGDPDSDGLTNAQEQAMGTHPRGLFTRYFAEGATAGHLAFKTRIATANPGTTTAKILYRFQKADGTSASQFIDLNAMTRHTLDVASVAGMANAEFSTICESDQLVVSDRTMEWDDNFYASGVSQE